MMKLNSKIISTNIVVHYVAIFIATVAGYWLIYWITMWGLFGIANVLKSESVMNWLSDENYFFPARESALSNYYRSRCVPSPFQADSNNGSIEEGLEYLKHDGWLKEEMDSIQCLVGLYDELNEFDLDRIKTRNDLVEKSPELSEIVYALEKCDIEYLKKPYNHEGDFRISPRLYLKSIKREIERQSNSQIPMLEESNSNKISIE